MIRQEFSRNELDYKARILCIKNVPGTDKYDLLIRLVEDMMRDSNFARWSGDNTRYTVLDGYTFRLFNGEYYETVCSVDVIRVISDFLRENGVGMGLLMKLSKMIHTAVVNCVRMKVLQPRPTLMCFRNGVVDFAKNGRLMLHSHSPKYDVVKKYDFDFDLMSYRRCPIWKNFLGEPNPNANWDCNLDGVLPELTKRRQLQMFLGSLLLDRTKVSFEYFMILQGDGGNGKGVIYKVLEGLFGRDEVSPLDLSHFSKSGDEKLRAAANLEGKRLMYCPEEHIKNPKTLRFIKSLASGEPIPMRRIGGNIETVSSPPIIMFNTNHRWKTSDFLDSEDVNDKSMLRRVKIINFERTVPVERRDTMLADRLMNEKAGIFAWIVKGFLELKKNRYRMPESKDGEIDLLLEKARANVSIDGKDVSGIVALYLERKKTYAQYQVGSYRLEVTFDQLYNNFMDFCKKEGLDGVSKQKFGRDLGIFGFEKDKSQQTGRMSYTVYCTDMDITQRYLIHVPTIIDEVNATLFQGEEITDTEFDEYVIEVEKAIKEEKRKEAENG